jgi:hypothetical protein
MRYRSGDDVRRSRSIGGYGRLGCFLWLAFAALLIYAGIKIVPVKFASARFEDFIAEEAAFAGSKGNPQIIQELLSQARELELPVTKDQLEIKRTREAITIAAHYEVPIEFFFGQLRYVWSFDPVVARPLSAM